MKKYVHIFILGFILNTYPAFSQTSTYTGGTFVLNQATGNGNREYLAQETITLSDGFHIKASTDGKFRAALLNHVEQFNPLPPKVPITQAQASCNPMNMMPMEGS